MLEPLERTTQDVYSGIAWNFSYLLAVCKWIYMAHTSLPNGVDRFCINKRFVHLMLRTGIEVNLLLYCNSLTSLISLYFIVLFCPTATLSGIWSNNGPQLPNYLKVTTPRTQQTKDGQQKNHNNTYSLTKEHGIGVYRI